MTRADTTKMLSKALEGQVLKRFPLWAAEVKLNDGDLFAGAEKKGRVDYMAFEPLDMSHSIRSLDAGKLHVFEVKSCMADLKSGHGMNRIGDVNWIVCTADLWCEIIDKQVDVSGWQPCIYEWRKPGQMHFNEQTAYVTSRKLPLVQAIWMMLTASAKVKLRGGCA